MVPVYLGDAKFWRVLLRFDEALAAEVGAQGCRYCGARLHSARYPRKPRGVARAVLRQGYGHRLSLCCSREGCRRRTLPPSVRFLGRRVYLGALVVLVTALSQGVRGQQRTALVERFGVSVRTLARWRRWWREVFPATPWWRGVRGRFVPALEPARLPSTLLARFSVGASRDDPEPVIALLRFIAPLSTPSGQAR